MSFAEYMLPETRRAYEEAFHAGSTAFPGQAKITVHKEPEDAYTENDNIFRSNIMAPTTKTRRGRPAIAGLRIRGSFVARGRDAQRISRGAAAAGMREGAYALSLVLAQLDTQSDRNMLLRELTAMREQIAALTAALAELLARGDAS